jgi:chromosome segregation ATPase
VATLISVSVAALLFINRQYVIDQVNIWQYQPSPSIEKLVDRSGMNDQGEFYFYASTPTLESTQVFNDKCGHREESTAILGCYAAQKIYIYNVTDARLDGIREVTAAHEMLHAAYERMGDDERKKVDALLETEYSKLKNDKNLSERMAFYAKTEPGQRDNELHSVIGTEVASISKDLEEHYKKYFTDRQKVVALHAKYATLFSDLQARSDELVNELKSLGNTIEADTVTYNNAVSQLDKDIESFNTRANNGEFSNQAQFNAERNALMGRVSALDRLRDQINANVAKYESLREELASIASTSEALNRSIDSSLAPAPSI